MKMRMILLSLLSLLLIGCVDSASVKYGDSSPHYKSGPPPHAPAHGYRYKHNKHHMSYDSGLSVYVVMGKTDVYYDNGVYFRYRDSGWQVSLGLNSNWENTVERAVPRKLYKSKVKKSKHHKKHPSKGKSKDKKNK